MKSLLFVIYTRLSIYKYIKHTTKSKKLMEIFISNWSNVEFVPKKYIFPPERRPGKIEFPVCNDIPLIDLAHNHPTDTIQKVIRACQEFGIFQVQLVVKNC